FAIGAVPERGAVHLAGSRAFLRVFGRRTLAFCQEEALNSPEPSPRTAVFRRGGPDDEQAANSRKHGSLGFRRQTYRHRRSPGGREPDQAQPERSERRRQASFDSARLGGSHRPERASEKDQPGSGRGLANDQLAERKRALRVERIVPGRSSNRVA